MKRLPDKKPFYSIEDERLEWLDQFCEWLEKWKTEVVSELDKIPQVKSKAPAAERKAAQDKKKEIKLRGLTKETHDAMILTSRSTAACVKYLLKYKGFVFLLTRRMTSDEIEQMFGALRQLVGGNFKLDAQSGTQAFERIVRTGIARASVNGNVPLTRETQAEYALIRASIPSRKRTGNELMFLPSSYLTVLLELEVAPDEPEICSQSTTLAFVAGYLLRVQEEQEFCTECLERLSGENPMHPLMILIRLIGKVETVLMVV